MFSRYLKIVIISDFVIIWDKQWKKRERRIPATLTISIKFLPIQLIYEGKTFRYLLNFDFPVDFNVTFSDNHWSNTENLIEVLKKLHFRI